MNSKGEFNVPYDAYDRRCCDPDNLKTVSLALSNSEVRSGDFEFGIEGISSGDFAYFDPPYCKIGDFSDFNRSRANKFREKDHFRLAALCRELDTKGIKWAVSNSNAELVKNLYMDLTYYR